MAFLVIRNNFIANEYKFFLKFFCLFVNIIFFLITVLSQNQQ